MRPPRHLVFQWHLTERCNLRCLHCYQSGQRPPELDPDQLLEVLEQLAQLIASWRPAGLRRAHVTVTGGEPFVRRDFLPFLERLAAKKGELSFAILTNGTLIDASMARRLARLGPAFVQVSLEGTAATHDAIRGEGSHRRTIVALQHLVAAGVKTQVSFTAHRGNHLEFGEVARQASRLGVGRLWADRLIPSGAGGGLTSLGPAEARALFAQMAAARKEVGARWFNRTEISMRRALQFLVGGGKPYRCTAGDTLLTLMANGQLVPCRRMPLVVGDVRATPLAELYQHPLLRKLRDREQVAAGCESCPVRRDCGGGLRCLANAVTGSPFRADPGCWIASGPQASSSAERVSQTEQDDARRPGRPTRLQ